MNADAAMGYSAEPGWRVSFEYDYIHQDQLRNGRHAVSSVPDGNELERETLNRYLTLGLDYNPSADWNIDLRVPYVIRTHSTYGEYDSTAPLPPTSSSRSSSIGDIRLTGAYQGFLPLHNLGLQLGIKLPTGQYGTAVKFGSDEYFALLKQKPRLAQYFSLGERVVVILEGRVYRVNAGN